MTRCGTHAALKLDSYPAACGNYMMVKEQFTKKKNSHCADGNKSSKSNKNKQLMLLVNVPQLCFKIPVSVCNHFPIVCIHPALHCDDRSVNIDIISLHNDDSSSCRKLLISSACACMWVCVFVWVRTQHCVDCRDRSH